VLSGGTVFEWTFVSEEFREVAVGEHSKNVGQVMVPCGSLIMQVVLWNLAAN
jgi:hypothetical protein